MTSSITITEVGQIGIWVSDLVVARKFYHQVLGLAIIMETDAMVFLQAGNLRLMIGTQFEGAAPTSSIIVYLRTDDIDGAVEHLKTSGAEILQEPMVAHKDDTHTLYLAFFKDPDGNSLAFMEERSE